MKGEIYRGSERTLDGSPVERVAEGIRYIGLDDWLADVLIETVLRLPGAVQEFALERCVFMSVGDTAAGIAVPGKVGEDRWLIVLAEDMPPDSAHSVVAHEIAHSWLGHDLLSPDLPEDCEVRAAETAARWGFTGAGAEPDHYGGLRCGDWDSYRGLR